MGWRCSTGGNLVYLGKWQTVQEGLRICSSRAREAGSQQAHLPVLARLLGQQVLRRDEPRKYSAGPVALLGSHSGLAWRRLMGRRQVCLGWGCIRRVAVSVLWLSSVGGHLCGQKMASLLWCPFSQQNVARMSRQGGPRGTDR